MVDKFRFAIPLTKPYISQYIKDSVIKTLESGFLTEGKINEQFEKLVASHCEVPYAISVPNATIGLELVLRSLKTSAEAKEVIIPSFTHPATALAVARAGMIPVIIDIDSNTMLIDYNLLNDVIGENTAAIMPVSLFGNPIDYSQLNIFKKKAYIVEDAACSIGSIYNGLMTGSLADASVFSFHPRKIITTGEGGMILTSNPTLNTEIRSTKNFGSLESNSNDNFKSSGSNYKLSDIQASIGVAQMLILDKLIKKRQNLANKYSKAFENIPEITIQKTTKNAAHSYQTYCILIENRNKVMNDLRNLGIEVQIGSYAIHRCKRFLYESKAIVYGSMKSTDNAYEKALALPLYPQMSKTDQQTVIDKLIETIRRYR